MKRGVVFVLSILFVGIMWTSEVKGDWQQFFVNSSGDHFYYEDQSTTRPSNTIVKARVKALSGREDTRLKALTTDVEIDCSKRMYRRLEEQALNHDGTIRNSIPPAAWTEVVPQSNMESLAEKICKKSTGRRETR